MSEDNVPSERSGSIALRMSLLFCSLLPSANTTSFYWKTRLWIGCRRRWPCSTVSATVGGLSRLVLFCSWTRSIGLERNCHWVQCAIISPTTKVYLLTASLTSGGDDYNAACDYILNRFVSLNQSEVKQVSHYSILSDNRYTPISLAQQIPPKSVSSWLPSMVPSLSASTNPRYHHTIQPPWLRSPLNHHHYPTPRSIKNSFIIRHKSWETRREESFQAIIIMLCNWNILEM